MGIPNLLRFMKPFIEPVHIKKYAGQRVGIDAYSWLHKGAYSCSMELCMNPKSAGARRYISYFMHHVNLLRHHKVVPVVVFDGGSMPCKSATDEDRHKKRELSLVLGKETLKQGNTAAAIDFFRKAVQITPSMAYQLIQILRSENVEFVVAPYEADAQLAYLASLDADQGGIAAVITEDSDLIAYGCTAIIFKMDRFGKGEEFIMDKTLMTVKDGLSFQDFDQNLFTGMCVLAGCDFLPSVSGIGTKRAYSLVSKHKSIDLVLSTLKLDKRYSVPDDYTGSFWKTLAVFNHARVYDVKSKSLKHLKPLEEQYLDYLAGDLDILGPYPYKFHFIHELEYVISVCRNLMHYCFSDSSVLTIEHDFGTTNNGDIHLLVPFFLNMHLHLCLFVLEEGTKMTKRVQKQKQKQGSQRN
uniref:Uncharacterized protein n=2 Tax=Avena sativa TaxID=4498 RepID=A0ACD6AIG6_AVESA